MLSKFDPQEFPGEGESFASCQSSTSLQILPLFATLGIAISTAIRSNSDFNQRASMKPRRWSRIITCSEGVGNLHGLTATAPAQQRDVLSTRWLLSGCVALLQLAFREEACHSNSASRLMRVLWTTLNSNIGLLWLRHGKTRSSVAGSRTWPVPFDRGLNPHHLMQIRNGFFGTPWSPRHRSRALSIPVHIVLFLSKQDVPRFPNHSPWSYQCLLSLHAEHVDRRRSRAQGARIICRKHTRTVRAILLDLPSCISSFSDITITVV